MDDLATAILDLYGREINCRASTFWDGGLTVELGDELNGFYAAEWFLIEEMDKVGEWLRTTASRSQQRGTDN